MQAFTLAIALNEACFFFFKYSTTNKLADFNGKLSMSCVLARYNSVKYKQHNNSVNSFSLEGWRRSRSNVPALPGDKYVHANRMMLAATS